MESYDPVCTNHSDLAASLSLCLSLCLCVCVVVFMFCLAYAIYVRCCASLPTAPLFCGFVIVFFCLFALTQYKLFQSISIYIYTTGALCICISNGRHGIRVLAAALQSLLQTDDIQEVLVTLCCLLLFVVFIIRFVASCVVIPSYLVELDWLLYHDFN